MTLDYIPLKNLPMQEKTILLRIDGNIPTKNKHILDDFKLQAVKPTIDYLMRQKTSVILLTHIGNPKEKSDDFSTNILMPWFLKNYHKVHFVKDLEALKTIEKKKEEIILFENVRFFKEETQNDINFAQKLAQCGDFFVNDAFGTLHRNDTSISLLPTLFDYNHRSLGLLIEREIENVEKIWKKRPIILIVGGGKPESKIKFVQEDVKVVEKILLCPLVSTRLHKNQDSDAQINSGLSGVVSTKTDQTKTENKKYVLPIDYIIERTENNRKIMIEIAENKLLPDDICISIGHKTITLFKDYLERAETIIWNGYMGFTEQEETLCASKKLAAMIAQTNAYTIIAGSDTGYFVRNIAKSYNKDTIFSTGGGALLAYIAKKENLPGLIPFRKTN